MRILAALAVLATLAWGGYWVVGSRALDSAISEALRITPELSAQSHRVSGFPNRFDVTLDDPRIDAGEFSWSAPFAQIFALTYKPHHLLAVFANDQSLSWAGREAALRTEDLRASLVMEPALDLPLERFTLVGDTLALRLDGMTHRADGLRAASRRIGPRDHDLVLLLETVLPDPALMDRTDPERVWPRAFHSVRLNAMITFDRPLDRHAVQGAQPQVQELVLTGALLSWDGVEIAADGRLEPDANGLLNGEIRLSVQGFRALMVSARAAGLMPAEHDALVTMAMEGLVSVDDPERLDAAFLVTDGMVSLGPITIARLPPLFRGQ